MASRVNFSGQHLELEEIGEHYADVDESLKRYFSPTPANKKRFDGYSQEEIAFELRQRLVEQHQLGALSILGALEAAFRMDYLQRVYARRKDDLSQAFRALYKAKGARVSLEDDILEAWKAHSNVSPRLVGDLCGALKYRHWLAHGRYWTPKLGQRYDYDGLYEFAEAVLCAFPMLSGSV